MSRFEVIKKVFRIPLERMRRKQLDDEVFVLVGPVVYDEMTMPQGFRNTQNLPPRETGTLNMRGPRIRLL